MTRICPDQPAKTCQDLLAGMGVLAARFPSLAADIGPLSLLDLNHLQPLMASATTFQCLTALLSPEEALLLDGFAYSKRRLEWLGGRLAAKYGLSRLVPADSPTAPWSDWSILPDPSGRPSLGPGPMATVSISHSRGYAAALVTAAGSCGIDIQQKSPQLAKVQERFATSEELALAAGAGDLVTRLALIWTAKEAVKKCLLADQPTFFGRIRLIDLAPLGEQALCRVGGRDGITVAVRIADLGDYLIACTGGDSCA